MKDLAPIHHGKWNKKQKIMQPQFVHHKEIEKKNSGWMGRKKDVVYINHFILISWVFSKVEFYF